MQHVKFKEKSFSTFEETFKLTRTLHLEYFNDMFSTNNPTIFLDISIFRRKKINFLSKRSSNLRVIKENIPRTNGRITSRDGATFGTTLTKHFSPYFIAFETFITIRQCCRTCRTGKN